MGSLNVKVTNGMETVTWKASIFISSDLDNFRGQITTATWAVINSITTQRRPSRTSLVERTLSQVGLEQETGIFEKARIGRTSTE